MLPRSLAVPTLLAASVAVPYVATNAPQLREQLFSRGPAAASAAAPAGGPGPLSWPDAARRAQSLAAPLAGPGATLYPTQTPLEGVVTHSLADVLRMDVTKEWVYQHWARKSTALAELDLFGIRVPLVTGTQLDDVAGSLTYFFDQNGRVQRLSFRGRTGDTTELVGLVTQRFGLQRQPTIAAGEQLFQALRGQDVLSELRTKPAPVLWASSPHDSFSVELELQDPATARPLAPRLAPLPQPPAPAQPTAANGKASGDAAAKAAGGTGGTGETSPAGWNAFFPRSRVPKPQVRNLDKDSGYR